MLKGLAALLILVSCVVGVPVALVKLMGNPLPRNFAWGSLTEALGQPDDGTILIGLITVVAWLAWLVFAASVVIELVTLVSGFRLEPQFPGLGGLQRVSAGLLLAVVTMLASPLPAVQAAPPVTTPSVAASPPAQARLESQNTSRLHGAAPTNAEQPSPTAAQSKPVVPSAGNGQVTHVVALGDDLWSLADHYYGEGRDWRRIARANPERLSGGPDRLEAGWKLIIPDLEARIPMGSDGSSVRVKSGDSLSSIAAQAYGDSSRWPEIYAANRAQLEDPDDIEVGTRLALPDSDQTKPEKARRDQLKAGVDTANTKRRHQPVEVERHPDRKPTTATVAPTVPSRAPSLRQTPPLASSTAAPPAERGREAIDAESVGLPDVALGVASVGGFLAAGLVAALASRRRLQLQARPVGRRIRQPPPSTRAVETAMGRQQRPMSMRTLDLATRAVAADCRATGSPVPVLSFARLGPDKLELIMTERVANAPVGFSVAGRTWTLEPDDAHYLTSVPGIADARRPYPALVSLGTDVDGGLVVVDLEAMGTLSVLADDPAVMDAVLGALALELSFSLGADELFLTLLGGHDDLIRGLGQHNVTQTSDVDEVLTRLERRAAQQRLHQLHQHNAQNRIDPDLADPWAPEILLVTCELSAEQERRLQLLVLAEPRVSLAAVIAGASSSAPWTLNVASAGVGQAPARGPEALTAVLDPLGLRIDPQLLPLAAREAVLELVSVAGSNETSPAPWWDHELDPPSDSPPDNVTYLGQRSSGWGKVRADQPEPAHAEGSGQVSQPVGKTASMVTHHPVLLLLGPVELVGANGTPPSRAAKQILEYCGWLLEHPGTTAQAMASGLVVAEGTRRSNMSRLRTWLGTDSENDPYLPDAYSGRIFLHPSVSSDWHRLQILTAGGVNRTSTSSLTAALELVRGAPLADAAPTQWPWAEELRTDMISVIRDIGVEITQRALAEHDIDLARWAASRALVAAPGDELLLAARIKTEHEAGNVAETERLTLQLAAQARALGVDLNDDTVVLLQEVIEGRVRARMG